MNAENINRLALVVLLSAAAIIVGSLMPWANISGLVSGSIAGTEGDGVVTMALGAVLAIVAVTQNGRPSWSSNAALLALLISIAALGVAVASVIQLGRLTDIGPFVDASPGAGLYVVIMSSVVAGVAAATALSSRQSPAGASGGER